MFQIRQQHWFCLAAVCLVGSLLSIWSSEIPVAEEESQINTLTDRPVLRRLSDLPQGIASDLEESEAVFIQAPAGVAGRMASPLNTTARIISRERISHAGYQQVVPADFQPIQLTGQIEPVEISTEQ